MFSFFNIPTFNLGPITIHTWGFLVSIGFALGIFVAYRRARAQGLDGNKILDIAFWIIVSALIGARIFHVFFYEWHYYQTHIGEILRIDQGGLSSFGGIIAAAATTFLYMRAKKISFLPYANALMFAWPLGHAIGRIGCYLTNMHPGRLSDAFFAVQMPGGSRLDMGLIEAIGLLVYWVVLVVFERRHLPSPDLASARSPSPRGRGEGEGRYLVSGMLFYGVARFVLDFFRATDLPMSDARYFGLTPAQYGSITLVVIGIYLCPVVKLRQAFERYRG